MNINELPNEDKISKNANKMENIPKIENWINSKNLPIKIIPVPTYIKN